VERTPLTPGQEREWEFMWALSPTDPGAARMVVMPTRVIDGPLNYAALWRAFADVTRRHDALRLSVPVGGPSPQVHLHSTVDPPVRFIDLSRLSETRQRERIGELMFLERRRTFHLANGPLWNAMVVRLSRDQHLLGATLLHLIADGWAAGVFMNDLLACYGGRAGLLPAPAHDVLSFSEIFALQAERLAPTAERVAFWRARLARLRGPTFPSPVVRADADLLASAAVDFELPATTTAALRRMTWRARTTPFVGLLAAFHIVLALAIGDEHTTVSTTTSGRRTDREKRSMLQFASEVYVANDAPGSATLATVVRTTHAALDGAIHNLLPYTALARIANPRFDAVRPWPDTHLRDGDFSAWPPDGVDPELPGLRVQDTSVAARPPAGWVCDTLVGQHLPPVWEARCGPSMVVNTDRSGGALLFNDQLYDRVAMAELLDAYLWTATRVAEQSDLTMQELRRQYRHRFGSAALLGQRTPSSAAHAHAG
jgi:hypothetical protein